MVKSERQIAVTHSSFPMLSRYKLAKTFLSKIAWMMPADEPSIPTQEVKGSQLFPVSDGGEGNI